ncbi:MAG: glycosyltransferase [Nitratireductor sp.]
MKVHFVIQKLTGLTGGAERILVETAVAMRKRGFDVRILTFEARKGKPGFNTGEIPVINLFPFARRGIARGPDEGEMMVSSFNLEQIVKMMPHRFPIAQVKWGLTHGFFIRCLKQHIRRERPSVLIPFMPPAITACAYAAAETGTPVIASTHNVPAQDFGPNGRWDANPLFREKCVVALSMVDRILVLLPEFRDWFPDELKKRVAIMPNPVRRLASVSSADVKRGRTVLGVGRLTKIKRFDILVRAWARLGSRTDGWTLRILGDGPERIRLQKIIDDLGLMNVEMPGVVSDMAREYDQAMILCHPAEFEGFGLAVSEALAHGVPAIGFEDCPGVNTLIEPGRNGILVASAGEPENMFSEALSNLMQDDARREDMAVRATTVIERYGTDAIHDRWERAIRDVTAGGVGLAG